MSTPNLKMLIDRLDTSCKQSLESATEICLRRQHFNVELEHWLQALLSDNQNDFCKLLLQNNCSPSDIINGINHNLEKIKCGNEQTPAISPRVIDWINEAWLIASLEHNLTQITIGTLLLALVQNPILNQLCLNISSEFAKLATDKVKEQFVALSQQPIASDHDKHAIPKVDNTALQQFAIDLTELAQSSKLDAAVCREKEVQQIMQILARRRQNNAILVGDPGVGKTAIVEGLALRVIKGDVPDLLNDVKIYSLDLGLLQAGASIKGEFEKRLKALIDEVKSAAQPIILFIDEAHTLIGAGGQSGQNDAANLLKPALARGELHCIAATTWREYKQYFENDAALTRRFQVVKVLEPEVDAAVYMLRSMITSLEKHHNVLILDKAIKQAVNLSKRYISDRFLPDKAISVLDTACARVASQHNTTPALVEQKQKYIAQLEMELTQLAKESAHGIVPDVSLTDLSNKLDELRIELTQLTESWQTQSQLVQQIIDLTQKLRNYASIKEYVQPNELQKHLQERQEQLKTEQCVYKFIHPYVDDEIVADVISQWTDIPVGNMLKDQAQRFIDLQNELSHKIIGQHVVIEKIANIMKTAGANLMDPNKPMGVFLFIGPSGVGKTETALVLAESLFGNKSKIITINMSEFKEAHKVALLTGAPPGYVGYGEGGILTEAVRRKPYSIVLLDEMEKAHPSVQDIFYQVFDKGVLQDSQGRIVNFKNTLIIMTANCCDKVITENWLRNPDSLRQAGFDEMIQSELLKTFKPAFLGRIKVMPYIPLDEQAIIEIANIKLQQIEERLSKHYQIRLKMTDSASHAIANHCISALIGARKIDAILNEFFLPKLAELVLNQLSDKNVIAQITINYSKKEKWQFKPEYNCENPDYAMEIANLPA